MRISVRWFAALILGAALVSVLSVADAQNAARRARSEAASAPAPDLGARLQALDAGKGEPLGCLIEPSLVVEVGSPVIGVIDRVFIERGDAVQKGQVVAQLESNVERAAVAVALARFQSEAEVQSAVSAQDFARRKQERNESLFRQNFISNQALDQSGTEERLAEMQLAQAQDKRVQSAQEVKLARAQLAQRTITSPVTGVVVERYMARGERVEEKPIVKIAQIDPLRVEVILPAARFRQMRTGMSAKVFPELAETGEFPARVTIVDRVIDAASNTFRVRLEMRNPGLELPPGLRCKVEFES